MTTDAAPGNPPANPQGDEFDDLPDSVKVTEYEPVDPDPEAIVDELPDTDATTDRGEPLVPLDDDRPVDDFDDPDLD
jgi:hypothetical protein